ncbi:MULTISPECIES: winged helix-turn-helix transcriptional regulator [Haloglomus]|jgi:predicted transcriptional regulator|uniref:winged helix-turn-helix transcriptional regulator n=1 Tax=Haloglomus TaxID=2806252 RepID=UPI0020C9707B|nr:MULTISPECIES: winged helix-turn-helix transcriptional regulator [Haloglomus]
MIERLTDQVSKEARDLQILQAVIDHHPIGIVRISKETGIPEHKVRYSLRMLENDGLIDPTQQGAVPADDIEGRVAEINAGLDELADRVRALASEADEVEATAEHEA